MALYGGVMLCAVAPGALADDGEGATQAKVNSAGEAMDQEDDASATAAAASTAVVEDTGRNVNVSTMMRADTDPQQYHADGTVSVKMGLDSLNYLAVKLDEDGNPVYLHTANPEEDLKIEVDDVTTGEQ